MSEQISDKILDRIVKLLALAGNNPNPEEAASAAAKAQELMTQYNLDLGSIERKTGQSEKREKEAVEGGFYKYNRDLYKAVAELNFCMHWLSKENIESPLPPKNSGDRRRWKEAGRPNEWLILRPVHKLLGRRVNVAATKVMASYLEQAVERILREEMEVYNYDGKMLYSKWAMSFREGAVANLVSRIQEERERAELERQSKAKEEKARASHPGAAPSATGTALVLSDYKASEEAANYDARYGEGAWARRVARIARYDLDAKREEEGDECLKIFHPELWEAQQKAEAERVAAFWRSYKPRKGPKEKEVDESAFEAGKRRAEAISLNQQIDHEKRKQIK